MVQGRKAAAQGWRQGDPTVSFLSKTCSVEFCTIDFQMPYREYAPSPHLAQWVECFWTSETGPLPAVQRVMPDGCEDIVWIPREGRLAAIGTMTRTQVVAHAGEQTIAGVRFHPSMARACLGIDADQITDGSVNLEDLWGNRAAGLQRRLSAAGDPAEWIRLLGSELRPPLPATPVQQMAKWVAERGGNLSVREMARLAGVSSRHLRRLFLRQTGLPPKLFCRIVRFRSLVRGLSAKPKAGWAQCALDAGYYDQSHFVKDFCEFSGLSPTEYAAELSSAQGHGRFFQDRHAGPR
jgi:AraC-like DNA-binding protein